MGVGDRVGYSLGADGKPTTVDVQKAGSSSVARFDTNTDKTKNVVDQSNEYTGPMEKQSFASPGGLVNLTMDSEGRAIQGSMDGTLESKQIVERKDPNGTIRGAVQESTFSASGSLGFRREMSGQFEQIFRERVENVGGYKFEGIASGMADELVTRATGSEELGNSAGRVIGATQGIISELRGIGVGTGTQIQRQPNNNTQQVNPGTL